MSLPLMTIAPRINRGVPRACYEPGTIDVSGWRHGNTQALPERCERRGVGLRRSLPDPYAPGCRPAPTRPEGGVQRPALQRQDRYAVADDAQRPVPLGCGLPADPAVARSRFLRGHRSRSEADVAPGSGADCPALGGYPGQPNLAVEPRERPQSRIRRGQTQEG